MIHPSQGAGTLAAQPADDLGGSTEDAVYRKVWLRIIPFLFICYVVSFLDRINIGFAQLQMKQDLGFSDAMYGLGAAVFYVGYVLCEVPSNMRWRASAHAARSAHHDPVGTGLGGHDGGHRCQPLLCAALPAGRVRGRLLPGHRAVPELLVPGAATRAR
jgi:hypothetical protein